MKEKIVLAPQKGPQEMFLATSADICIYGGAAGGGKTFAACISSSVNAVVSARPSTIVSPSSNLIRSLPNSVMFPGSYVYAPFDIRYQLPP